MRQGGGGGTVGSLSFLEIECSFFVTESKCAGEFPRGKFSGARSTS